MKVPSPEFSKNVYSLNGNTKDNIRRILETPCTSLASIVRYFFFLVELLINLALAVVLRDKFLLLLFTAPVREHGVDDPGDTDTQTDNAPNVQLHILPIRLRANTVRVIRTCENHRMCHELRTQISWLTGAVTGGVTRGVKSVIADCTIVRKMVVNWSLSGSVVGVVRWQLVFQEIFLSPVLYVVILPFRDV